MQKKRFKIHSRLSYRSLIDITSLVDMTFLLVAFFMITSSFGVLSSITVHLPKAQKSDSLIKSDLIITVNKNNEIFINDIKFNKNNFYKEILKYKDRLKGKVIIRGDKNSNYDTIVTIMDYLNQAGINNFTLATTKSK